MSKKNKKNKKDKENTGNTDNTDNSEENKFRYYSNLDHLMDYHDNLKSDMIYLGLLNSSLSTNFIYTIINNIHFYNKSNNNDSDSENENENEILFNET